ncbi:MAG: GGDEF domain-containing protein [Deltaproteobacteria bacterium]|nr:GGDEF domain-containing protein [Deltaproteobacteria bacterium]MBN2688221.1 GGDEF domain-containing protein [Deltaproteobacteria bacterium]
MKQGESHVILLGRMANLALSCITDEEALSVTARFLPQLFPRETGVLYIRSAGREHYEPVVFWGDEREWTALTGQECWALRRRRIYIVGGAREQPPCPHGDFDPEGFTSFCIPMSDRKESFGLLHLLVPVSKEGAKESHGNRENDVEDLRRLAALTADVLALLFVNLRLRKKIDDLSVTDSQTGCFNRAHWELNLEREIKAAQRTGRHLAIILMDIDYFGRFTENHGHGASSKVLQSLGRFVRENIRDVDVPSRYGADEIALFLPDTTGETARQRAENLHEKMRDLSLRDGHAHMRRITLSMGVAAFPDQGETACDLIESVKKALKRAKKEGRNRIVGGDGP